MAEVHLLSAMARGMAAGEVGTIAMTVSELLEISLSGREGSQVPGQVGAHLLPSRDPQSTSDVATLNKPVHWVHGISMGAVRGLLDVAGLRGPAASAAISRSFYEETPPCSLPGNRGRPLALGRSGSRHRPVAQGCVRRNGATYDAMARTFG